MSRTFTGSCYQEIAMRFNKTMTAAVLTLCLSAGMAGPAFAAVEAPFTQAAFTTAQKEGKPILVYISATWCPTCAKQKPILDTLEHEAAFKDLIVYHVDFDTQKDVVRAMGAQMQSTLVVFHGATEKGRSTGDTNAASLKGLLEKANG
jgi:thioredoxin 1